MPWALIQHAGNLSKISFDGWKTYIRKVLLCCVPRALRNKNDLGGAKPRTKNEFIDLLELKRFRQKKHSQTQSGPSTSSSSRKTDNSSASLPNSLDGDLMSGTRKRRAVISSDSDDSDVEETRNLNEYRTTIEGLRRKHKTRPSSSAKPAAVPKRKKSQLAKRMFFNIQ
jgi:hypothetical protein